MHRIRPAHRTPMWRASPNGRRAWNGFLQGQLSNFTPRRSFITQAAARQFVGAAHDFTSSGGQRFGASENPGADLALAVDAAHGQLIKNVQGAIGRKAHALHLLEGGAVGGPVQRQGQAMASSQQLGARDGQHRAFRFIDAHHAYFTASPGAALVIGGHDAAVDVDAALTVHRQRRQAVQLHAGRALVADLVSQQNAARLAVGANAPDAGEELVLRQHVLTADQFVAADVPGQLGQRGAIRRRPGAYLFAAQHGADAAVCGNASQRATCLIDGMDVALAIGSHGGVGAAVAVVVEARLVGRPVCEGADAGRTHVLAQQWRAGQTADMTDGSVGAVRPDLHHAMAFGGDKAAVGVDGKP